MIFNTKTHPEDCDFYQNFLKKTVFRKSFSGGTNGVVIKENEAESWGFSKAEASLECVVVDIVWSSGSAFHFCFEQRGSD